MVSVLASSVVDRGFTPKTIKLAFVASAQSMQHYVRRKSKDWLARNQDNVSESAGTICLSVDCCFSELAL